jgi:carbonic anhydrase
VRDNLSATEALARLLEGNRRFIANVRSVESMASQARRAELVHEHSPFAAVLGCSDSRAPLELIFDQGLGDLFVIRVAGNIVAPSQVASVEFAAERFGVRLALVMGHTHCGAVEATLESLLDSTHPGAGKIPSIVARIRSAVEEVMAPETRWDRATLLEKAVRANVRAAVKQLRRGSEVLERLILEQRLVVAGAVYDLETGRVEVLDPPAAAALP